jgi:hypothetical protein
MVSEHHNDVQGHALLCGRIDGCGVPGGGERGGGRQQHQGSADAHQRAGGRAGLPGDPRQGWWLRGEGGLWWQWWQQENLFGLVWRSMFNVQLHTAQHSTAHSTVLQLFTINFYDSSSTGI